MKLKDENLRLLDGFTTISSVRIEQDLRLKQGVYPRATSFTLTKLDLMAMLFEIELKQREVVTNE